MSSCRSKRYKRKFLGGNLNHLIAGFQTPNIMKLNDKQVAAILVAISAVIFIIVIATTGNTGSIFDRARPNNRFRVKNGTTKFVYTPLNETDIEKMVDRIMRRRNFTARFTTATSSSTSTSTTSTTRPRLNETENEIFAWSKSIREIRAAGDENENSQAVDANIKKLFDEVQKEKDLKKPSFYDNNENARSELKSLVKESRAQFKVFNHPQVLLATDRDTKYDQLISAISLEGNTDDIDDNINKTEHSNKLISELFSFLVDEYNKKGNFLTAEQKVHLATILVDQVPDENIFNSESKRKEELKEIKQEEKKRLEFLAAEMLIPFPFGLIVSLTNSRNYRTVEQPGVEVKVDDLDKEWEENKKNLDIELQKEKSLRKFVHFERFHNTLMDLKAIVEDYKGYEAPLTEESLKNYKPDFAIYNELRLLPLAERDDKYWQLIGFIKDPESREEYFNRDIKKFDLAVELYSHLILLTKEKGGSLSDDQKIQLAALVLNQTTDEDVERVLLLRKREKMNVEHLEKKRRSDIIAEGFLPFPLNFFIAADKLIRRV